ncbi:MAG: DUF2460 domain-containing protein [Sulfuritalea sp.]|nr:DUF2460 domain-containing protein [Sulfuritalea sp.]
MSFIETPVFPQTIAIGSKFGPGYSTSIARNLGGFEASNQNYSMPLHEGDVSYGVRSQAELDELLAFFHGVAGMHNGFRFKNYNDFSATAAQGTLTVIVADTTWQMGKTYTLGAISRLRNITKPLATGITFTGGGAYTYSTVTGIVTKTSGANPTSWAGEFDTPVRFNIDKMLPQWETFEQYDLGSIPIIEVRI